MGKYIGLLILLLIIIVLYWRKSAKEQFMYGFWSADDEFLRKSDLSDMHLFIAPDKKAFLVMTDKNGDFISNQIININTSLFTNTASISYDDKTFDAIPGRVKLDIDSSKGTMLLYDGSKVYGCLIKDNKTSMIANNAYSAE
jgi:hypothetical protein